MALEPRTGCCKRIGMFVPWLYGQFDSVQSLGQVAASGGVCIATLNGQMSGQGFQV